jgi:hypothetical protein
MERVTAIWQSVQGKAAAPYLQIMGLGQKTDGENYFSSKHNDCCCM